MARPTQSKIRWGTLCPVLIALVGLTASADDPKPSRATESAQLSAQPVRAEWSAPKAAEYLDRFAGRDETGGCLNCHATYAYLLARPFLPTPGPTEALRREALENWANRLLKTTWPPAASAPDPIDRKLERSLTEVLLSAGVLAEHDKLTRRGLQTISRDTLDLAWKLQRPDGGWHWLKTTEPPSATDDHYGATTFAAALGHLPAANTDVPAVRAGIGRLREFLRAHPPQTPHQRLLHLMADHGIGGLVSDSDRAATVSELFALQRPDGGWAMASLAPWKRIDKSPQELDASDGYGTGLVVLTLRTAVGLPADDPRLLKAIQWIKTHQREDGYWYTRSPKIHDHMSTYVGTAYVIRALHACGQVPKLP